MTRCLLLVYFFLISFISTVSAAVTQTAIGHGNNLIHGKNNKVDNHTHVSDSPIKVTQPPKDYTSAEAKEDLEHGNYKDVVFEEKKKEVVVKGSGNIILNGNLKKERASRKKVLILTATNFETGIIHEAAQKAGLAIHKEVLHDHIVYRMGTLGGVDIVHMQPGMMGMLEPGSTPLILMSVFRDLQPDYVIATGIAFGRQSKGQTLGDILISRQLVNYESRKETNGTIIFRGDKVTCPMLERVNGGIHNWKGVKIHQGVVLSGNALVNSKAFLTYVEQREPEYVGGDMESMVYMRLRV
jgi:nucleoside phosphorylase